MANETFEELQGSEVIVDERQIGSLRRGKGYSRWALTSAKGWQLKHPKERETRLQQMNTNQRERLKPPRREKQDCSRWTPTSVKGWKPRGETRLEFYSTRYREQPVQSQLPLFQQCLMFKPRCKNFMQIWVHLTRQHAQLVQKDFLTSVVNQSLMIVCVVTMTSMLQNYTPLPTIADLCLNYTHLVSQVWPNQSQHKQLLLGLLD